MPEGQPFFRTKPRHFNAKELYVEDLGAVPTVLNQVSETLAILAVLAILPPARFALPSADA
jgi:hypothetical protein